jgi:hypothetical protein
MLRRSIFRLIFWERICELNPKERNMALQTSIVSEISEALEKFLLSDIV